ncbi:MAG: glycoside hydrolase family 38 C-terminal domain-containing protein [Armatimonadota bacterium]
MSTNEKIHSILKRLENSIVINSLPVERFKAEIGFARGFVGHFPNKKKEWEKLIIEACEMVAKASESSRTTNLSRVIAKAEKILEPIGKVAKEYTIHCCGHAHIDMNWLWPWQETVNVAHDTFSTVDTLMKEFPEFRFSQSQASTYYAMQQYCPEIFQMIKRRVRQKKWEITASMWVEGEKNFVSGESLCRHLLYTRQYMQKELGLSPEDVKIDWSPDTFGHAHTVPSILSKGGVTRYYHMRTGPGPWLYKWRSPDGSEIIVYNDKGTYNGSINSNITSPFLSYIGETKLKDFMFLYGVGDHGGGPTRADLRKAREMAKWPIYPTLKLSTTDAFFSAIEAVNPELPVIDRDLNFIFEGCYTSQSNIKHANRRSEIILPEAEILSLIAGAVDDMPYPSEILTNGWRYTLFNHFHDILPGSGIKATYEYSQGLFQEIQAISSSIKSRSFKRLASLIDTKSVVEKKPSNLGNGFYDGLGAGAGDAGLSDIVTSRNAGSFGAEPVVVYNSKAWKRSELVYARIWNKDVPDEGMIVRDSNGNEFTAQVVDRGFAWGHSYATIAFFAKDVPALGYKLYVADISYDNIESNRPPNSEYSGGVLREGMTGVWIGWSDAYVDDKGKYGSGCPYDYLPSPFNLCDTLENDLIKVVVDKASGAIKHIIDKASGYDYVPSGKLLGVLEGCQEVPHSMTSWVIGQCKEIEQLTTGAELKVTSYGPNRASLVSTRVWRDSKITLEIGLNRDSKTIEFKLNTRWVERGTPETGVPMLRVAFPLNVEDGIPTYEIPFGSQTRVQSAQEIPALKWVNLTGKNGKSNRGFTLANYNKYGFSCNENTVRMTLIRSSYDPDPLPEIKDHEIKFALTLTDGSFDVVEATKLGEQFNSPLEVVSAGVQSGPLPAEKSFVEVLTPNIFVSTIKKAENSNAVVIRMFESEGKDTQAKIRISDIIPDNAKAVEVDILERPLSKNTAKMSKDTLTVSVPAYSQATVMIG